MHNPKRAENCDMNAREREPQVCLLELVQIVMQGIYPSEVRLEYMLDHIEGTP